MLTVLTLGDGEWTELRTGREGAGEGLLRFVSSEKMRLPALESEPMRSMRMIQTIKATNTGTMLLMVEESIKARDSIE